jgi:hypothetical protein
VHTKGALG